MVPAVAPIPANTGIGFESTAWALQTFPCSLAVYGGGGVGNTAGVVMGMMSTSNAISRIPRVGHKTPTIAPDTNRAWELGACNVVVVVGTIHSCFIFHVKKKDKFSASTCTNTLQLDTEDSAISMHTFYRNLSSTSWINFDRKKKQHVCMQQVHSNNEAM